ncbi:general secretion pathway protein I [Azotobacter beijerinckii]|uniref:Type II secretion system protein I n=1 Tax=Azotobacter beijerinckii TaxID=170623 RepID=A0A1H6ZA30_9GAMM|nr:type II secretion system minor pseudopilin GspI [Azotobacter beijerinckii]SEJ46522.1 general secretion pathway protein I [Azotobacter beijerinckii]
MNPSRQHGLTLLELLVALSIFALAAGALLKIVGEHGRHAGQLELRYFAQLAAQNHLASLHLQPAWPALGKRTRKVELAGHRFTLTEQVEGTDNPDIRRVTARTTGDGDRLLSELQAFMGATP